MLNYAYLQGALAAEREYLLKVAYQAPTPEGGEDDVVKAFIKKIEEIQVGTPKGLRGKKPSRDFGGANGPSTNPRVSWSSPMLLRSGRR